MTWKRREQEKSEKKTEKRGNSGKECCVRHQNLPELDARFPKAHSESITPVSISVMAALRRIFFGSSGIRVGNILLID